MGRGNESYGKRDVRAKNEKKRKEKEQKRLERKNQSRDGNDLDQMIAYVNEFGQITSTPPDLTRQTVINVEDIEIGVPRITSENKNELIHRGILTFFDGSKGYGFIKDTRSGQDVFVHINDINEKVSENNIVTFEVIKGTRGLKAINVSLDKDVTDQTI
jgi:cold shock CspA family protein